MILVKKGDLLISGINAEKGAIAIYDFEEDALATIHYSSYTYDARKIDINFLKWFLKSPAFKAILNSNVGSGIKTEIKPKRFLALEMYLPELEEQAKIVNHIQAIEGEIAELQSLAQGNESLVTTLRQAILTEAVQGRLTAQWRRDNPNQEPAGELLKRIAAEKARLLKEKKIGKEKPLPPITAEEMPYEAPEGWVWCRLGEVIMKMDAGKSPQCENRPANPDEWGVLKTTSIQKLYFDESENKALPKTVKVSFNLEVTKDDILITRAGPRNRVGIVCAVKNTRPQLMLSDKTVRVKVFDELIFADALAILLSSGVSNTYLESKKSGMAESQVNISQENMKYTPITLPPVSEQHAIVQKVSSLLAYCDELEQQVRQSKADLDLLMQAVLGEVFGNAA